MVFLWIGFKYSTGGRGMNLAGVSGGGERWRGVDGKETRDKVKAGSHMFMRCIGSGGPRGASGRRLPAKPPEKPDIAHADKSTERRRQ